MVYEYVSFGFQIENSMQTIIHSNHSTIQKTQTTSIQPKKQMEGLG